MADQGAILADAHLNVLRCRIGFDVDIGGTLVNRIANHFVHQPHQSAVGLTHLVLILLGRGTICAFGRHYFRQQLGRDLDTGFLARHRHRAVCGIQFPQDAGFGRHHRFNFSS